MIPKDNIKDKTNSKKEKHRYGLTFRFLSMLFSLFGFMVFILFDQFNRPAQFLLGHINIVETQPDGFIL